MSDKTIGILGAGGAAGIGMTRCLNDHYTLGGTDTSPWATQLMQCNALKNLDTCDLILPVPDKAIELYVGSHNTFLPPIEQITLCQDKAETAEMLGTLAPKTYWLRDTTGAGGKGAQMLTNYLPGKNYSVEFVYYEGTQLARFQKQRVSYSTKERTTGLDNRGSSMVSVCTNNTNVWEQAEIALLMLGTETNTALHGFYGVDLKCDEDKLPRITEINCGRLLTASYNFYHLTGYNLPLVGVKAYFKEEPTTLPRYPVGYGLVRQVDCLPKLVTPEVTNTWNY